MITNVGFPAIKILLPTLLIVLTISSTTIPAALAQSFITYNDPNGKFSISYPSGWSVMRKPLPNMTGYNHIFVDPGHHELVTVGEMKVPPAIKQSIAKNPNIVAIGLSRLLNSSIQTMTSIDPIDCSAFTIAGHIACITAGKMTTVQGPSVLNLKITSLISYINGTIYLFQGGGQPQDYSQAATIFGQMLSSFKPTKS
jgi:hypothetical protein